MHLTSLKIKNFRALEDVEVSKLGQVNLIVGKNNSGKSTVLEALMLLAGGFNPHALTTVAKNRNKTLDDDSVSITDLFTEREKSERVAFSVGDENNRLHVECLKVVLNSEQDPEFTSVKINTFLKKPIFEKNISIDDTCRFALSELNRRPLYSYGYVETQTGDISALASSFDMLLFNNHENAIIRMLQIIEPKIQNVVFLSLDNNFYATPYVELEGVDNKVPLTSMGEGMLRLLQIIIRLYEARDGFLLIDEFENGLHYSVQQEAWNLIFELAKRHDIQVFATTHSWDCIENFAEVAKERQDVEGVLFRMGRSVRKSNKDKIIATVFDEDELYTLTKDKIEVR